VSGMRLGRGWRTLSEKPKVPCNMQVVSRFPYKAQGQNHKYGLEGVVCGLCVFKLHKISCNLTDCSCLQVWPQKMTGNMIFEFIIK